MSGIVGKNLGRGSGLVKVGAVGADSVTGASIADDAIDSEHYVNASIDNAHLADNAADTAEIADNAITLAKMAGLARGKLIYGDASGDPAALAVGSADEVLTHDGTDFDWAAAGGGGGGITAATQWRLTSSYTDGADPIASNLEQVDGTGQGTLGSSMTESSGIFTFPSTGYWLINAEAAFRTANSESERSHGLNIDVTLDNSSYTSSVSTAQGSGFDSNDATDYKVSCMLILDVTNVTNVKCKFRTSNVTSGSITRGSSSDNLTAFTFIRLGDT